MKRVKNPNAGQVIRNYRWKTQLTAKHVSRSLAHPESSLYRIETGAAHLRADEVARFCQALSIPPQELIEAMLLDYRDYLVDMYNETR